MTRLALAFLLLLAAPAMAQNSAAWLHGSWFGSGQPGDKSQMWLDVTAPDGSFRVQHRACREGKAFDNSTQDGTWSLKGDILTIRLGKVDEQTFARTDIYRILKQDGRTQSYRYEATGFVYNSRKVDGKFQMPPCDLSS